MLPKLKEETVSGRGKSTILTASKKLNKVRTGEFLGVLALAIRKTLFAMAKTLLVEW